MQQARDNLSKGNQKVRGSYRGVGGAMKYPKWELILININRGPSIYYVIKLGGWVK